MSYLKSVWFWVVVVVAILVLSAIGYYNRFVSLSNGINAQWAQVEVQYQRRLDLIPNLVESVKGIFKQEQAVFNAIAEARTKYGAAQSVDEKAAAATQVEGALGRLLVVLENYPQLRSAENVSRLMDELAGTENRVSVERRRYNEIVNDYNNATQRFPGVLFARLYGFGQHKLFEAQQGAEKAPQVKF